VPAPGNSDFVLEKTYPWPTINIWRLVEFHSNASQPFRADTGSPPDCKSPEHLSETVLGIRSYRVVPPGLDGTDSRTARVISSAAAPASRTLKSDAANHFDSNG
jgi:hypothetical protein